MTTLDTLKNYLKMLYPDMNVPAYIYDQSKRQILYSRPDQSPLTWPPSGHLERLTEASGSIAYISTEYGIYYGCVAVMDLPELSLVFGPVSLTPYSDEELRQMNIDYVVPLEEREAFHTFLQQIPQLSLNGFCRRLLFLNYCINQEMLHLSDILHFGPAQADSPVDQIFENKSNAEHNNSWQIELAFREIIKSGRPEDIANLEFNESAANLGITGPTALRQLKNNIIISTTLATRAAMDGGLDPDEAYQLSDTFIQTAEKLSSPDALQEMIGKIAYTFAERVRDAQIPVSTDDIIRSAIYYIQKNTCERITVEDVANHLGFSRSYFSTYFKKVLGFSVNAFIRRCKMEEAKQLLKYTDKPVSIISSYLCFSSQSHFQSAFKKQYGMTPLEYRKDAASYLTEHR